METDDAANEVNSIYEYNAKTALSRVVWLASDLPIA
jgi:hypothetical protein